MTAEEPGGIAAKIGRLVREKGWNQEDFARIARINRHTAGQILTDPELRKPRNNTISQCASALGLRVAELRDLPLERLLPRMHGQVHADEEALKLLRDRAGPELKAWLVSNPDRAERFTKEEAAELLRKQDDGLAEAIDLIERRRQLLAKVRELAETERLEFVERFVDLVHKDVMKH